MSESYPRRYVNELKAALDKVDELMDTLPFTSKRYEAWRIVRAAALAHIANVIAELESQGE